jgi:predicted nucleic acid-binding protein
MIVLDTNVLSEEMKPVPAPEVHRWLLHQNAAELFTTAVNEAEILAGAALLPEGRRKRDVEAAAHNILALSREARTALAFIPLDCFARNDESACVSSTGPVPSGPGSV